MRRSTWRADAAAALFFVCLAAYLVGGPLLFAWWLWTALR